MWRCRVTEILPKARAQSVERRNDKQQDWKVSCEEKYQGEGRMGPRSKRQVRAEEKCLVDKPGAQ